MVDFIIYYFIGYKWGVMCYKINNVLSDGREGGNV